jgi:hypothetical protein
MRTIRNMGMGLLFGQMEGNISENGRKESNMEEGHFLNKMDRAEKENGLMEEE